MPATRADPASDRATWDDTHAIDSGFAALELTASPVAVAELLPAWRPPRKVLVNEPPPGRIEWLARVVPDAVVCGFSGASAGFRAAEDADVIVGWASDEMIAAARELRWWQLHTAGIEPFVDVARSRSGNIVVTSMKGVSAPLVAEHAIALLLCAVRGLAGYRDQQRRRVWQPMKSGAEAVETLFGARLLVIGGGAIGRRVAALGGALGMEVTLFSERLSAVANATVTCDALCDAAARTDAVVAALPLTVHTRGVLGARFFGALRRGAFFVNVGRGQIVDHDALLKRVNAGSVGGVGLDVTDPEPLPRGHAFWRADRVALTPHVAARLDIADRWSWLLIRENLMRYARGDHLLSVVDLDLGY